MSISITVTLLASPHPLVREALVARLRSERPDVAICRHELATLGTEGVVHRVVHRLDDVDDDVRLGVEDHCCLSCLLRDDALATLDGLARDGVDHALLVLPASVEAGAVARILDGHDAVQVRAVVTALEADDLEEALYLDDPLLLDVPPGDEDERTNAEVVARQLAHADVVLHRGGSERAVTLIGAMAPGAVVAPETAPLTVWLDGERHDATWLVAATTVGVPRPWRPADGHGVASGRWVRRRPIHPARFAAAVESGELAGSVWMTGYVWTATRPRTVLELELLPIGYELSAVGGWVEAVPDQPLHPLRAERTADVWDPYWGDRSQDLVVVALDRDLEELVAVLDGCLLTDEELAEGQDAWRRMEDPFHGLGDEADHLAPLRGGPEEQR